MKINQEEVVDHQTVLQIELEDKDLDTYLDKGYRKVVQHMLIPGFRKGKAPRSVLERYVGRKSLLSEVLESMLPEVTSRAIAEQELEAAALPQVELVEMEPFTLKATVPLTPEVELGPYRDIRLAQEDVEVTKEDVQQRLQQLRESKGTWEPADRPVQMGDTLTMDVTALVEGRSIFNNKDAVLFLEDNDAGPFPQLAQRLVGLAKEKPTEFSLSVPEDYSDSTIAGKEANFSVTIGEIKERILPEMDDEFAKGIGDGYASLDELRQEVEKDLNTEAEAKAAQQHKESVFKALLDGANIELPPLLIERESEHMEDDRSRVLDRVNVRMDDYLKSIGKTEEEMQSETREEAVDRLNRSFALRKVAELEGVEITDEEVEERAKSLLSDSGEQFERQPVTDEIKSSVRRMVLAEKSIDQLVAIAKGEAAATAAPEEEPSEEKDEAEQGGDVDDTKA